MARTRTILIWCLVVLALGLAAYFGAHYTARAVAEMKVQEFLAQMQDVAKAEYDEVDVSLLDMSAEVRGLHVEAVGGVKFDVDELRLSRFEQLDGYARAMAMSARGVRIPLAQEGLGASVLRGLGYDLLTLDYDLDFDYDPKSRWFRLRELMIHVRDAGRLGMRISLSNVDLAALMEGGPEIAFMAVQGGELSFMDESLLGRILEYLAAEEGTTLEEVRGTILGGIADREAVAAQKGDQFTVDALQAVRNFVASPENIELHAEPLEGVAIMQLMALEDPVEMLTALNLHFEVYDKE